MQRGEERGKRGGPQGPKKFAEKTSKKGGERNENLAFSEIQISFSPRGGKNHTPFWEKGGRGRQNFNLAGKPVSAPRKGESALPFR